MIYADNAATTQLHTDAFEAMRPFFFDDYGNASQPYSFARPAKIALKDARETIAHCIGAEPDEIYFTSGGTESDNWAIKGLLQYGDRRATITSEIEHHAVLNACKSIERLGYPVSYLPVTKDGTVTKEALLNTISSNTKLVSIMYVNNEIGTIEPIKDLCEVAHNNGALFHTDAVQAVGHLPINVRELGIDMLSASAHKFYGPKGVGFFYAKRGTHIFPYADGGSQEFGMRAGTENVASIVGMATALKKCCSEMCEISQRLLDIEQCLISKLKSSSVSFVRNGGPKTAPGIVSLSFKDANGEQLLHRLDLMGIMVSTGSACDGMDDQVSHVLRAITLDEEYAPGTIRVSFGKNNTVEDADRIASAIIKILSH